jgi:microcystin-dependent protein
MSDPFLGEIKLFAGNFEPPGWLTCDGRLLAIRDHESLFEILGNSYGGDGRTTFGLPDLRGRVPMGVGAGPGLTNRRLGEEPGAESVVLDVTQLPSHDHTLRATNSSATQTQPAGNVLARASTPQYLNAATSVLMGSDAIGASGSNAPHANVQPSTVLRFIIAIAGKNPRDEMRILRGISD